MPAFAIRRAVIGSMNVETPDSLSSKKRAEGDDIPAARRQASGPSNAGTFAISPFKAN
jgi:hypothetical protein